MNTRFSGINYGSFNYNNLVDADWFVKTDSANKNTNTIGLCLTSGKVISGLVNLFHHPATIYFPPKLMSVGSLIN